MILGFFGLITTLKIFQNNIFQINSTRAFDFFGKGPNFFFNRGMTIRTPIESPDRVD
jgi:hypothetical protein